MKDAITRAKLGHGDWLAAIHQLDRQARALEQAASGPQFDEFIQQERARSARYGGHSVFGPETR